MGKKRNARAKLLFCLYKTTDFFAVLDALAVVLSHATTVTWRHTSPFYIVSDVGDHYVQFALFHSPRENTHIKKRKIRDYSHFALCLNMLYFKYSAILMHDIPSNRALS